MPALCAQWIDTIVPEQETFTFWVDTTTTLHIPTTKTLAKTVIHTETVDETACFREIGRPTGISDMPFPNIHMKDAIEFASAHAKPSPQGTFPDTPGRIIDAVDNFEDKLADTVI
jgi:hypothetical protein